MSKLSEKREALRKPVLKQILACIKPYRFLVLLSFLLAIAYVFFTLWIPILIGSAVDKMIGPGNVDFPALGSVLLNMLIAILIAAGAQWFFQMVNNRIVFSVVKNLRQRAFDHIQELPLSYLDTQLPGDMISRVVTDTEQFSDGLLMGFSQLFTGVLTIVGTIIFMLTINPFITIIVVLLSPLSFLIARFVSKRSFSMFKKQSETRGELNGYTDEALENLKVIQAFGYSETAEGEFSEINEKLSGFSLRATFFSSLVNPTTRFMYSCIYAGVAIVGSFFTLGSAAMTIGKLTSFLSYTNQYTKPFNDITSVISEFQNALACAERVFDLLAQKPQSPDEQGVLPPVSGHVSLNDVSFSYVPERPLIEHLNLQVSPGQKIAIVGPTGCGKTTLINLLMRFYDVDRGAILVENTDIRSIPRADLRGSYGMVLQETWLKAGTIRENITYGKPDATEEEVLRAAKASHAHSFISKMPQGYDTRIGEDGGSLSQGQKQLLCITRVMLSLPPMLILDEATSSIDTMTEIRIQNAFREMTEGRTSFVVAHRLSTIRESDVILVMKDGHIIEQGNHEELLKQRGFYSELYNSQFAQSS